MHAGISPVGEGLAAVQTEITKHLAPFPDPNTGDVGFKLRSFMAGTDPLIIDMPGANAGTRASRDIPGTGWQILAYPWCLTY